MLNVIYIYYRSFSEIPEVSIVSKVLQEKEKAHRQRSLSLENKVETKSQFGLFLYHKLHNTMSNCIDFKISII